MWSVVGINCDKRKDYCKLKIWAKSVIERDKVCKKCGKDYNLQAHHMRKMKGKDKYYYDKDYGVCLCRECHLEFHKYVKGYFTGETTLKYILGVSNWNKRN